MTALSLDAIRDTIVHSPAFQRSCQRYAHGNGSSETIAMAVLTSVQFDDLYLDALRYRWLREKCRLEDGSDLDAAVDGEMDAIASAETAGAA